MAEQELEFDSLEIRPPRNSVILIIQSISNLVYLNFLPFGHLVY